MSSQLQIYSLMWCQLSSLLLMGVFPTSMFKFRNVDVQDLPIWGSMLFPADQYNKVLLAQKYPDISTVLWPSDQIPHLHPCAELQNWAWGGCSSLIQWEQSLHPRISDPTVKNASVCSQLLPFLHKYLCLLSQVLAQIRPMKYLSPKVWANKCWF